jgi:polyisoprenyl-phosphate glycosyltransferase
LGKRLVTVSIPVFNEEENITRLLDRLDRVCGDLSRTYDFEYLFTDNNSEDATLRMLEVAAATNTRVRVLKLSRNFGFQQSILTNFLNAKGDAAIQIDADMQDPPEMIAKFLESWEKGFKVVYGVRKHRPESVLLFQFRKFYYWLVNRLAEFHTPEGAGDFRLVDRVIIEHLRDVQDRGLYLRGIIAGLGYPQLGIEYDRDARVAGASKFGFVSLLRLGIDGLTSQSTKPLQLITMGGLLLSLFSVAGSAIYFALWLLGITGQSPGFTTIVFLQFMTLGVNAFVIGIMGEYVGRIFNNVRGHPIGVIEREIPKPEHDT